MSANLAEDDALVEFDDVAGCKKWFEKWDWLTSNLPVNTTADGVAIHAAGMVLDEIASDGQLALLVLEGDADPKLRHVPFGADVSFAININLRMLFELEAAELGDDDPQTCAKFALFLREMADKFATAAAQAVSKP